MASSMGRPGEGVKMAVIHTHHPEITLTQEQGILLQNGLENAIRQEWTIPVHCRNYDTPRFHESFFEEGVFWITCANKNSQSWLIAAIRDKKDAWKVSKVTVVETIHLPKRVRLQVRVANSGNPDLFTSYIRNQNPNLSGASEWLLLNHKDENDGQVFLFSIDDASFKVLKDSGYRAFYKLGTVIFEAPKKEEFGEPVIKTETINN